jgi:RNA polymerase sigma-70 factor, ECF subfamily
LDPTQIFEFFRAPVADQRTEAEPHAIPLSRRHRIRQNFIAVAQQPQQKSGPGTLGDVLYPNQSPTVVVEQDWEALVSRIASGDQAALHALYERSNRIVFTLIMRITRDRETAEELTVDVFHDVWRRASRYEAGAGTVVGWIMNQARSRAIDRIRYEQRKKRVDPHPNDPPVQDAPPNAHDALDAEQQSQTVRAALAVLNDDEKRAIEAAYFDALTHAEVAEQLNEPLGTIKTRIRSGLQKLRHELAAGAKNR